MKTENKYYRAGKRTRKVFNTIVVSTLIATNLYTVHLLNKPVTLDQHYNDAIELGLYDEQKPHDIATNPATGESFTIERTESNE